MVRVLRCDNCGCADFTLTYNAEANAAFDINTLRIQCNNCKHGRFYDEYNFQKVLEYYMR